MLKFAGCIDAEIIPTLVGLIVSLLGLTYGLWYIPILSSNHKGKTCSENSSTAKSIRKLLITFTLFTTAPFTVSIILLWQDIARLGRVCELADDIAHRVDSNAYTVDEVSLLLGIEDYSLVNDAIKELERKKIFQRYLDDVYDKQGYKLRVRRYKKI